MYTVEIRSFQKLYSEDPIISVNISESAINCFMATFAAIIQFLLQQEMQKIHASTQINIGYIELRCQISYKI